MNLINCPKCGKQVSEYAPTCPACGEVINKAPQKKVFCKHCGAEMAENMKFCPSCGGSQLPAAVNNAQQQPVQQPMQQPMQQPYAAQANNTAQTNSTTVVVNSEHRSNGIGTAGFVFAIISIFVCWVPVLDLIIWFLGALFSFIGLFKKPRGLAIAGFILSFIGIIILVTVFGSILLAFSK